MPLKCIKQQQNTPNVGIDTEYSIYTANDIANIDVMYKKPQKSLL